MKKMRRWNVINHFVNLYGYNDFLEIGVRHPSKTHNKINTKNKDGVDPDPEACANYVMTSDEFFKQNKKMYDIIFIDGLHEDEQVMKDVDNSLKCLNKNGTILLHDCKPLRKSHQRPFDTWYGKGVWTGTVWKAFVRLRSTRKDLYMKVIDCDYGVGIIRSGHQKLLKITEEQINYQYFRKRKKRMLNLITVEEFFGEFK